MFGLFVNFSYPLTRTLIDISNITSLNIYASAVGPDALTQEFTSDKTAGGLIMNKLGLQGLIGSAVSNENLGILSNVNSIPGALVAVAYVFYAAYIFFQVTAIFVMRTLALVFIIIASPLLLVDSVLPMLGEKAKELRGIFFNQLIVGPVFMIMLALTLKFLDVFSMGGPAMTSVGSGATGVETIKTFFNIMMMLGMLHIMFKVTKHFAGKLGEMANNAFGAVTGVGLGMATGGLGLAGRYGIGKAANYAQNKGWVSKDPNSMGGRIANTLSTSSFDIRNSSIIAGAAGKLGMNRGILGMGGMGGGAASKASFQSNADAKAKRIEASANARFKTKYERDTVDEDGFHRKGDDNLKQIKARQEFMASKGSSLFLTKEQQQKFIDDETDAQADRSLADHNKLKTKDAKEKNLTKLKQDLETSKLSDPKLESAKSQALVRTIYDIEKKDKDEKEAFEKQVDNAMFTYDKKTGADREKYLTNQTKEIHEAMQARINPTTSTSSPTTTTTPLSSTSSPSSSSTPLVADTDWGQLNSPAVNRREKAATSQAPVTTTTTPSSSSGGSPIPEAMVPFPTLDGAPSAPAPLTGIALREERIKKVAEGRAADVEMMKNEVENLKGTDTPESVQRQVQGVSEYVQERQQNSAAKAKVFGDRSSHFAQRRAERQRLATEQLNRTAPQSQNQAPAPQPTQQVEEEVTS
jgi:hypothetical protein